MIKITKGFVFTKESNNKYIISLLWIFILSIVSATSYANDGDNSLKFSTGFDYSSGSYGLSKDTEILYVPLSVKYEAFPWNHKLIVPYIRISGPGGVVAGADGVLFASDTMKKKSTKEGLGDVVISSGYSLDSLLATSLLLDLTAKAKIGTADAAKGLGTGENDYSIQLEIARKFGKTIPYAMLGYKMTGDPKGFDLNDVWYGSIGADYKINSSLSSGLNFDSKEAIISTSDVNKEAVAYLNWKMTPKVSIMAYGVAGFSDSSPKNGIGVQIRHKQTRVR